MGLNLALTSVLVNALKNESMHFDKVLTIGRLERTMSFDSAKNILQRHRGAEAARDFIDEKYADRFIKKICMATSVQSIDLSSYENCDIQADLNQPIDHSLHGRFDAVIDGGTLEHIYNAPVAMMNYMNLVKQGGRIFIATAANNHLGHGFYQFSPEFFFRTFSGENGFEVREMFLVKHPFPSMELGKKLAFFQVVDPEAVGRRVGLCSRSPVSIVVHAVRKSDKAVMSLRPIQSDYASLYKVSPAENRIEHKTLVLIKKCLPARCVAQLRGYVELYTYSFLNKKFFTRKNMT